MENNLSIYNQLKEVPEKAQKQIKAGRLKGMTDIKPMWRIEKLTEVFGPVGIGWKTKTTNKQIIEGANEEKIAIVDIELFVNYKKALGLEEDLWSEAIEGSGGSSFVAKEKNGLYTSDECFKMAYTDALSVACRSLGMGADIYWGDSKYNDSENITTKEQAENYVIKFGKKHPGETLKEILENDPDYIDWLFNNEQTDKVIKDCITLLTGQVKLSEEEQNKKLELLANMKSVAIETFTDIEKILETYHVEKSEQMTISQLEQAIRVMKKRKENNNE